MTNLQDGTKLSVVVGGQFGSEGKGAVVAALAPMATDIVRVAGPNAGHCVHGPGPDGDDHKWRLRSVPAGAVTNRDAALHVAAGSEVDLQVLFSEIDALDRHGYGVAERLTIHPQATWLGESHIRREQELGLHKRIGSTAKGIGAARADRIWRTAQLIEEAADALALRGVAVGEPVYAEHIVIEGTQGYGLGLHAGHYPKCTSSDCRAIDFMAMAGISPWDDRIDDLTVWVVARANPIRVAGDSGPLEGETSWEALGLADEYTTVTNKVRRVGAWDPNLVADAVEANGGPPAVRLAFTMADHMFPEIAGLEGDLLLTALPISVHRAMETIEHQVGAKIGYIGTGPSTNIWVGRRP